jgi:hypothetical protein
MKSSRLLVLMFVLAANVSSVIAQETIRLQCELTLNGAVVATPDLRVVPGREGLIRLEDPSKGLSEKITLTPVVRSEAIAITFEITSGDRQLQPSLVISKDVRGSLEWISSTGQPIRLGISWVQ